MLVIDQTAGEVEETKSFSEAEVGCSETLIKNTSTTNNHNHHHNHHHNNNNKVTHVSASEVADTESKKSKPITNIPIDIHENNKENTVNNQTNGKSPKSAAIILTIGLTVHNILEGIAIGLSPSQEKLIMILIGICPHNLLESFYLGMQFIKSNWKDWLG